MTHRHPTSVWALVAAVAVSTGCEDKPAPKQESPSAKGDGGAERSAAVDKNIAEAVAAVAGGQPTGGALAGPPPTGVFPPGAADKEMKAGDPPRLTLGGKGSAPTVTFAAPARKAGKKQEGTVEVAVQTGPQSALPTVDLKFSFEGATAPGAAADAPVSQVDARVTAAKLAARQPGQLPPGLDAQIAKLKGSKIRFELQANGAGRALGVETPKEADPSLSQIARSAGDALFVEFMPYPAEPVGVGAYWMIASRESFLGLDVLAYRMVKLEKIEGDKVTLDVSTKRYAAGGHLGLEGLPPHDIAEFNGNTSGKVMVSARDPLAVQAQLTDVLLATLTPQGGGPPGQRMGLQLQVQTAVDVGGG